MNLSNLLNVLFIKTGMPDPGNNRLDYLVQQYTDHLNAVQDEICATSSPMLWGLRREGALSLSATSAFSAGTSSTYPFTGKAYGAAQPTQGTNGEYALLDWVQRPLEFWTEGAYAHRVVCRRPKNVNRDGLRSTAFAPVSLGPWTVTPVPRSWAGVYNFGSGASTGASATEGGTTVTIGSGASAFGSGNVGQMLLLNGEGGDYMISSLNNTRSVEVDRPIRSRMTANSQSSPQVGSGYTNVSWEVSPKGRYRIKILPSPSETAILYYSYMGLPRKLLNSNDTPDIQEEYHHLLWKGAMRLIAAEKEKPELYQIYNAEYSAALTMFSKSDVDDQASDDPPAVETLRDSLNPSSAMVPGTYDRYGGYGAMSGGY